MSINFEREGKRDPFSMPEQKDTHGAWKSKGIGYKTKRVLQNYTTANDYEDSLVFDMRLFSRVVIHMKEFGGVNALRYNLLACIDPSLWSNVSSDQLLATSGAKVIILTDPWNWVKLQVKSAVADTPAKLNAFISGKSP